MKYVNENENENVTVAEDEDEEKDDIFIGTERKKERE